MAGLHLLLNDSIFAKELVPMVSKIISCFFMVMSLLLIVKSSALLLSPGYDANLQVLHSRPLQASLLLV